jgi:putative oxidoreductase
VFENSWLQLAAKLYCSLIQAGSHLQSIFLLYMRLTWGQLLFWIGVGKWEDMDNIVLFFNSLGFYHPSFWAHFVAGFEVIGGACLVVGLASRLVSIPLICLMITALSTAHAADLTRFRFLLEPASLVAQAPYPYLITSILMVLFGPGCFSLDGWIRRRIRQKCI